MAAPPASSWLRNFKDKQRAQQTTSRASAAVEPSAAQEELVQLPETLHAVAAGTRLTLAEDADTFEDANATAAAASGALMTRKRLRSSSSLSDVHAARVGDPTALLGRGDPAPVEEDAGGPLVQLEFAMPSSSKPRGQGQVRDDARCAALAARAELLRSRRRARLEAAAAVLTPDDATTERAAGVALADIAETTPAGAPPCLAAAVDGQRSEWRTASADAAPSAPLLPAVAVPPPTAAAPQPPTEPSVAVDQRVRPRRTAMAAILSASQHS